MNTLPIRYEKIKVFLFTGFLDSGKSTFIQQTLENINFCTGEKTLLLLCEEGETEFQRKQFANPDSVTVQYILSQEELHPEYLTQLAASADASRVIIEYNGMWTIDVLEKSFPENWYIFREMLFIDTSTFQIYNTNMRQLMYDKLKSCTVAVFNKSEDILDKAWLHKVVRSASRRCDIAYQYKDGHVEYDDIEDHEPYDLNCPVIQIKDEDFAYWSRDISEHPGKYDGKTIQVTCQTVLNHNMQKQEIGIGRYVMVCCENDIEFFGLICENTMKNIENYSWITLTGKIQIKYHESYRKTGPVLSFINAQECQAPDQKIATFY